MGINGKIESAEWGIGGDLLHQSIIWVKCAMIYFVRIVWIELLPF